MGRIPWRNIREIDDRGDEYYHGPHLYCSFADNGTPYEAFAAREMGDDYDWPLDCGWGTFEEFFEVLTWGQLGLHRKPCGILNTRGYFDGLLSFVEHSIHEGFVRSEYRSMITVSSSADELIDRLDAYKPPVVEKWLDRAST